MTRLSVNINKIATLRNSRGGNNPDLIKVAQDCERFGAEGITVHPRPDGHPDELRGDQPGSWARERHHDHREQLARRFVGRHHGVV